MNHSRPSNDRHSTCYPSSFPFHSPTLSFLYFSFLLLQINNNVPKDISADKTYFLCIMVEGLLNAAEHGANKTGNESILIEIKGCRTKGNVPGIRQVDVLHSRLMLPFP